MLLLPLLDARIDLDIRLEAAPIFVEGSNDDFSQILMNLVVNARDAMPLGGHLDIETRICTAMALPSRVRESMGDGAHVCLCVRDSGEGVSPEIAEKMFDPFFTTKKQGSGTGLGLSIVYGLVKEMGGMIDVDTAVGQGTEISIYLPLSDKPLSKNIVGSVDDLETFQLKGYTVLLAEDEPDLLLLVAEMLKKLGANVLCARDGNEALSVQDEYEGDIDLLLSDVVMPDLGGIELSELLVSLRPEVKTIFMSGYPAYGHDARVNIPDNAFFLAKPIRYEDLVLLVYQCLNDVDAASSSAAPRWHSDGVIADNMEDRL
jgi:two-component system cell cycle sensor histidine kinase/response regulator CckA